MPEDTGRCRDPEITELLVALKAWRKAVKKLRSQDGSPEEREQRLEQARQQVLACLSEDKIMAELDALIQPAIAPDSLAAEDVRERLIKDAEPLMAIEMRTIQPLAVSRKQMATLFGLFLQTPDEDQPVANSEELRAQFAQLSLLVPAAYQATKPLSRKVKKQRRRDFTLGALQTALGLGLVAGNTQIEADIAQASYILGGNALLTALKHLVGQLNSGAA
jgi:ribosome-binding protein aMBF1 (putative translation factor)